MSGVTGLFIATPAYEGKVDMNYTYSLVATADAMARSGMRWRPRIFGGAADPTITRGILTAQFMATGYSHILFIDADLSWKPKDIHALLAASEHHAAVCAVYAKKTTPAAFPVNLESVDGGPVVHPDSGCWKLKDACTGFLMLHREVMEQMMAAYPERRCCFRDDAPAEEAPYEFELFQCFIDTACPKRMRLTEDFGFTRLYQGVGGNVWAHPEIELTHHEGRTKYTGKLADLLAA